MLRSLIHNPRRRGLVGALLFASGPYLLAAYNNGILLGGNLEMIMFLSGLCGFLALIGYGSFHGGFSQAPGLDDNVQFDWSDHDRHVRELTSETGKFAWMYDDRIGRFDQNR